MRHWLMLWESFTIKGKTYQKWNTYIVYRFGALLRFCNFLYRFPIVLFYCYLLSIYVLISAISTVTLSFGCVVPLSFMWWFALRLDLVEVADALLLPREPRREPKSDGIRLNGGKKLEMWINYIQFNSILEHEPSIKSIKLTEYSFLTYLIKWQNNTWKVRFHKVL